MTRKPFHQIDYDRGDKRVKDAAIYARLFYLFGTSVDIRNQQLRSFKRLRLI